MPLGAIEEDHHAQGWPSRYRSQRRGARSWPCHAAKVLSSSARRGPGRGPCEDPSCPRPLPAECRNEEAARGARDRAEGSTGGHVERVVGAEIYARGADAHCEQQACRAQA